MTKDIDVSIILRTRNEEYWVGRFAEGLKSQDTKFKVEIVLVDNGSSDRTKERLKSVYDDIVIVHLDKYIPGRALNLGIQNASGEYIVCISAHCIPGDRKWLDNLIEPLSDERVAAVYGRQLPLMHSNPRDKRDLWLTFGRDNKTQYNDPFLHNANAAYRTCDLLIRPFSDTMTNIEDREWAQYALDTGSCIYYAANAPIYHEHGIHQTGNLTRLSGVINMMEDIHSDKSAYYGESLELTVPSKALIIPISDRYNKEDINNLITKNEIIKNTFEKWDIFILPSNLNLKKTIEELGFKTILRNWNPEATLLHDIKQAVNTLSTEEKFFDIVGVIDVRNTILERKFYENAIRHMMEESADTVVATKVESLPTFKAVDSSYYDIQFSGWTKECQSIEIMDKKLLCPDVFLASKMAELRTHHPLDTNFCTYKLEQNIED